MLISSDNYVAMFYNKRASVRKLCIL